jgi:hypothetical protein
MNVVMTPDGSRIGYGGDTQLFVRALGQKVGGTTPPRTFDIAPDGLMIKQGGDDHRRSKRAPYLLSTRGG